MAQLQFNATQHAPAVTFDLMPAGWYLAAIDESEIKPTQTGGQMLVLRFSIVDGYGKGQKFWKRLNIVNKNPKAVEIAFGELSAICGATGFQGINDSAELHNIPMNVKVKVNPAAGEYQASNEPTGWKHVSEVVQYVSGPVGVAGPAQAPAQQAQQAPAGFAQQAQQAPAGQGIQQPVQTQQVQQPVAQQAQQFTQETAPTQAWQQPAQGQQPVGQAVQQQATQQEPAQQAQQAVQQTAQQEPVQQQAQQQASTTPAWAQHK